MSEIGQTDTCRKTDNKNTMLLSPKMKINFVVNVEWLDKSTLPMAR